MRRIKEREAKGKVVARETKQEGEVVERLRLSINLVKSVSLRSRSCCLLTLYLLSLFPVQLLLCSCAVNGRRLSHDEFRR